MDTIEEVASQDRLLAIIVRHDFVCQGIRFFTPPDFSQQLAYMKRPLGYKIEPHVHNLLRREVVHTQETLFVRRGRIRIDFYDDDRNQVSSRTVETGDVVLLVSGGHGFEMLEESEMIEVKQGPFAGDEDKVRFEPVGRQSSSLERE
jgi:hypothetical protein